MQDSEPFDRAIPAQARWKYRLADAIRTRESDCPVGTVRSDGACEFGKWILSLPLSERLSPNCQRVCEFHAVFHTVAADVLERALGGHTAEAEAAIALGGHFTIASSNLTIAVLAWEEAVRGR